MHQPVRRPSLLRNDHLELVTDAGDVAVVVRRDRRARNFTLRLKNASGAPVLTMPVYGSLNEARAFLERNAGWLARQLEKTPPPRPIADGAEIPLRGVLHLIRHAPGKRGTVTLASDSDTPMLVVSGDAAHLRRRVLDYLRREARRDIEPAALGYAGKLGARPKAIRIRDTVTRWGSCSAAGELSFSFRLIMAPPFVLDYLAAHEAAHLREMNHSRRFWRLVEGLCPDHGRARRWLMREGPALHAVGVERGLI